jgi:hypothetical protein
VTAGPVRAPRIAGEEHGGSPLPGARGNAVAQHDGSPPLDAVLALLADNGMDGARARAGGPENEIAIIAAPLSHAPRLAALAGQIRALGFRYVAFDLGSDLTR